MITPFSRNKKLFFLFLFALITLIPLLAGLRNRTQETRTQAAKSARLFFTPDSSAGNPIRKGVGQTVSLDLMVDPGQNNVSFIKFEILYDASKMSIAGAQSVVINSQAFSQTLEGPVLQSGRIAASISIGSDPTKGISTITKVATITFTTTAITASPVQVSYGQISQVLSLSADAQATEDVLSSTTPAYIFIGDTNVTITVNPSQQVSPTISNQPSNQPTNPPSVTQSPPTPTGIVGCNPLAGTLTGRQEVPETNSTETANVLITFGSPTSGGVNSSIIINSTMQNPVNAVHIHSPADAGVNAPPTVTLYTGSGTFPESFTTQKVIPMDIVRDMQEGKAYINIHTDQFPNGEIRGQLVCGSTTPAPSIDPRNTRLQVSILLHGIGSSGDNPNPRESSLSTKEPRTTDRQISIQVLNDSNQIVVTRIGTVKYNGQTGNFNGLVDLGIGLTEGNYVVKIKSDRYLRKLLPGFYELTPGKEFQVREIDLVAGDINDDNVLNVLDYNVLYDCGYGSLSPLPMTDFKSKFQQQACQSHSTKQNSDLNDNGIVSSSDYNLFIRELSVQLGE